MDGWMQPEQARKDQDEASVLDALGVARSVAGMHQQALLQYASATRFTLPSHQARSRKQGRKKDFRVTGSDSGQAHTVADL